MESVSPAHISEHLQQDASGIWHAASQEPISYTPDGHNLIRDYEDSFWYRHRNRVICDLVADAGARQLLEIGGGNGMVSAALQAQGLEVTLLEPGIEGIYHARERGLQHLVHSSLGKAAIKPNVVPHAGLFDVLEHIEDDAAFLQEIFAILVPAGSLVVTVPAFQSLYSGFDEEVGHYRRYSSKDLQSKLLNAGFEVERSGYFFSTLWLPAWFMRKVLRPKAQSGDLSRRRDKEHLSKAPLSTRILMNVLLAEHSMARNGLRLPFGTSCYAIARKTRS